MLTRLLVEKSKQVDNVNMCTRLLVYMFTCLLVYKNIKTLRVYELSAHKGNVFVKKAEAEKLYEQ